MLELIEIILEILDMASDHQNRKEAKAQSRKSTAHRSGQPIPDSNRIATGYGSGSASMPYPYTEFDQWHSM